MYEDTFTIFIRTVVLLLVVPVCYGDTISCSVIGQCSQFCAPTNESFTCQCVEGYVQDPEDSTKCMAEMGDLSILISDSINIRKYSPASQNVTLVAPNRTRVIAIDYDLRSKSIFWTDVREQKIYRVFLNESGAANNTNATAVIKDRIKVADGLAVDWIYSRIYWTDYDLDTISLANFDGLMRKTIIKEGLEKPRAIAVDPNEGWIFWSDWGAKPKLERSGGDGTHRETLVQRKIVWPNDITLDLVLRQVYWIDAKMNTLSTCNYDGSKRREVIESDWIMAHPFALTMFEDKVYWTDWSKRAVFQSNKFTGYNTRPFISTILQPMGIEAYHPTRQPSGTNQCGTTNGNCSHLCLPSPQITWCSPKFLCTCPDGLKLKDDGVTCEEGEDIPTPDQTSCPETIPTMKQHTSTPTQSTAHPVMPLITTAPAPVTIYTVPPTVLITVPTEIPTQSPTRPPSTTATTGTEYGDHSSVRIIHPNLNEERSDMNSDTVDTIPNSAEVQKKKQRVVGTIHPGAIVGIVLGTVLFVVLTASTITYFVQKFRKPSPMTTVEACYTIGPDDDRRAILKSDY